ncbi:Uncharacterized protein dnm_046670 [Desulfonema magnum]|uniref:Uncharacterized protein n=1 Tax=Desulfonema magnum TaxID=45655 RepID=A0A975GPB2_9BACT|nr:Uncharacterized protein dnm_046670 [Desulfonema magnum]
MACVQIKKISAKETRVFPAGKWPHPGKKPGIFPSPQLFVLYPDLWQNYPDLWMPETFS